MDWDLLAMMASNHLPSMHPLSSKLVFGPSLRHSLLPNAKNPYLLKETMHFPHGSSTYWVSLASPPHPSQTPSHASALAIRGLAMDIKQDPFHGGHVQHHKPSHATLLLHHPIYQ